MSAEDIQRLYKGEIPGHVEFTCGGGLWRGSGLPLVRFRSPGRRPSLMAEPENMGRPVWKSHVRTFEEDDRRKRSRDSPISKTHDPEELLDA